MMRKEMLLLCTKERLMRNSCAVRARPNRTTREMPSSFAEREGAKSRRKTLTENQFH